MDDLDYVLHVITPWLDTYSRGRVNDLGHRERIGVGVWLLETEVNNGGFDLYYSSTRGVLAESTVDALEKIGAGDTASLLRAANKDIPGFPLPEDQAQRFAILDEVLETARFRALETEFYSQREDRIGLLAHYLRNTSARDA